MERVRRPLRHAFDGAAGRDQRLADHLAAEHALPADLGRAAAKQIHLDRLEIENGEKILDGGGHAAVTPTDWIGVNSSMVVARCRC